MTAVVAPVRTATPTTGDDEGLCPLELLAIFLPFLLVLVLVVVFGSSLATQLRPGAKVVLEEVFAVILLPHLEELAVVDVAEVFEVFDGEMIPFHKEDARHEPVGDCQRI